MKRAAFSVGIVAAVLMLGTVCSAEEKPKRGGAPRPAEKPPEYGCVLLDLGTDPGAVPEGERIRNFLLKYRCREKTRPVDIEIANERYPGGQPELVKVASDVVLEKGEHTLRLAGGGVAHGGRYITVLKADSPEGKKDITRRVDEATCKAFRVDPVEKGLLPHAGDCEVDLETDPKGIRSGDRIPKFVVKTNCKKKHEKTDIRISWEPQGGGKRELVKVASDVDILPGSRTFDLAGGGVGRIGYYIVEFGSWGGARFKTVCTAWTLLPK